MNTEDTTVNTAIPALKSQTVESDRAYAESANDCGLGARSRIAAFEWRIEFMICNAIPVRMFRLEILQCVPDHELPNLQIVS